MDSCPAARGVIFYETGHCVYGFSSLGKNLEESVFDFGVLLGGGRVCEGGEFC